VYSRKLEENVLLLLDHPSANAPKSKDGDIRVIFMSKAITALFQPMDQGITQAFKAYYYSELLGSFEL
jgi:hypothetical protein